MIDARFSALDVSLEHQRRRRDASPSSDAANQRALVDLARHESALDLMFKGLLMHYAQCVAGGRLDVWSKGAHAIVDLAGCLGTLQIERRRNLP